MDTEPEATINVEDTRPLESSGYTREVAANILNAAGFNMFDWDLKLYLEHVNKLDLYLRTGEIT